jgi:hypothetical protein
MNWRGWSYVAILIAAPIWFWFGWDVRGTIERNRQWRRDRAAIQAARRGRPDPIYGAAVRVITFAKLADGSAGYLVPVDVIEDLIAKVGRDGVNVADLPADEIVVDRRAHSWGPIDG